MKKKEYKTEELLKAIDGSNGNMSIIADRLKCSWATARQYVSYDDLARKRFEGETEMMLDKAERIINDNLDSPDIKTRLETAKWLLSVKGKGRGYNSYGGDVLLNEPSFCIV